MWLDSDFACGLIRTFKLLEPRLERLFQPTSLLVVGQHQNSRSIREDYCIPLPPSFAIAKVVVMVSGNAGDFGLGVQRLSDRPPRYDFGSRKREKILKWCLLSWLHVACLPTHSMPLRCCLYIATFQRAKKDLPLTLSMTMTTPVVWLTSPPMLAASIALHIVEEAWQVPSYEQSWSCLLYTSPSPRD